MTVSKEDKLSIINKLKEEGRSGEYAIAMKALNPPPKGKDWWAKPRSKQTELERDAMYYLKKDPFTASSRTPEEAYKKAYDKAVRKIERWKTTNDAGRAEAIAKLPKEPSGTVQANQGRSPAANLDRYTYDGNGVYRRRGTNDFYDEKGNPITQKEAEDRISGDPLQRQAEGDASASREPKAQDRKETSAAAIKKYLRNVQSLLFNRAQDFDTEEFKATGPEKIYKLEKDGTSKTSFTQRLSTEKMFDKARRSNNKGHGDFLNATPAQLACLMPMLRFFIVDSKGNSEEIYFSDKVSAEHIKNIADVKNSKNLKDVLSPRKGEGGEAGIKSFNWNYNNKHEGDYIIEAELQLYFSTLVELANIEYLQFLFPTGNAVEIASELENTSARQSNVEAKRAQNEKRNVSREIMVLNQKINKYRKVLQAGNAKLEKLNSDNNKQLMASRKRNFRHLKVIVGWSVPDGNRQQLAALMPGDSLETFLADVKKTQTAVNLNLYDYNVNFTQEGPTTLSMKFLGSSDNYMATDSSDIFGSNNYNSKAMYEDTKVSLEGILSEKGNLIDKVPANYSGAKAAGIDPLSVHDPYLEARLKETGQKVDQFGERYINVQLAGLRFAQELVQLELKKAEAQNINPESGYTKSLRKRAAYIVLLYNRTLTKRLRDLYSDFLETMLDANIVRKADVQIDDNGKVKLTTDPRSVALIKQDRVDARRQIEHGANKSDAQNSSTPDGGMTSAVQDQIDRGKVDTNFIVYYALLGDIIKTAMHNADLRSDITLLLGQYEDINTNDRAIYNIPITMDSFGQFFFNRVVSKRLTAYPFRTFLNDFLNYTARLINQNPQTSERISFDYTVISSTFRDVKAGNNKILTPQDYHQIRQGILDPLNGTDKVYQNYYPIFTKKMGFGKRKGNRLQDLEDGIFHYVVGSDRGLAKRFNFSRQETAYYQEMLIESNNPADKIQALFLPQNVEIEMYGNGIHRNGDLIFVDTKYALGQLAGKILGIGGYYRVVRSSHTITNRGYVTSLSCVFELRAS